MNNQKKHVSQAREIIGLIPAGGEARRIAPLPCSKELYPIGFQSTNGDRSLRPKVVCQYLLEKMRLANVSKVYIILRKGKWDIPTYLGDGTILDMHLAYLMMNLPYGAPYTLDQAYPFVQDALVAFGFPDILFDPDDAFVGLLARQQVTDADVVLGLFPTDQPHRADMVAVDDDGRARQIVIKSPETSLRHAWIIAIWTPAFTRFMHEHLAAIQSQEWGSNGPAFSEIYVGDVIQAAIDQDFRVETVSFSDGSFLDIGTPESLVKAIQKTGITTLHTR